MESVNLKARRRAHSEKIRETLAEKRPAGYWNKAQEAFCQAMADGYGKAEAWRRAYNPKPGTKTNATAKANTLLARPLVAARIAELRAKADADTGMMRQEKRSMLAKIARNVRGKVSERIEAIKVDNVMAGHNEPEKVEIMGIGQLIALVRKESPKV